MSYFSVSVPRPKPLTMPRLFFLVSSRYLSFPQTEKVNFCTLRLLFALIMRVPFAVSPASYVFFSIHILRSKVFHKHTWWYWKRVWSIRRNVSFPYDTKWRSDNLALLKFPGFSGPCFNQYYWTNIFFPLCWDCDAFIHLNNLCHVILKVIQYILTFRSG